MQYLVLLVLRFLLGGLAIVSQQNGVDSIAVKPNALSPAFGNKPFVIVWNVNSTICLDYGVDLTEILDEFGILHNYPDNVSDDILLLYEKDFKYFPKFDSKTGSPINGGLPQNGNLSLLLDVYSKILGRLPTNFHGLGVIDWESWRALFDRMNSSLFIKYRLETLKSVRRQFPDWTHGQQLEYAKYVYDSTTQKYMKSVLEMGKILHPQGHWGFYLYPDCRYYNTAVYDYSCSEEEKRRNDQIQWLFDSSTALFPSVYIHKNVEDTPYVAPYVANRIREALRVDGNRPGNGSIPIFSYHILNYPRQDDFVDVIDLKNSIGIASLLGGSGAIVWGGIRAPKSAAKCEKLRDYVKTTLGPFCKIASDIALKCSLSHCNGRGRCIIVRHDERFGQRYLDANEAVTMAEEFVLDAYQLYYTLINNLLDGNNDRPKIACQCYENWKGTHCQWRL